MQVLVTFMIEDLEDDANAEEFAREVISEVGNHVIPYHTVTFVEAEVA